MKFMVEKDPNDIRIWTIDWSAWLTSQGGDAISSSSWVVPSGISKDAESNTGTSVTIKVSGGTLGQDYPLVNRIITAGGQQKDQTLVVSVRDQ